MSKENYELPSSMLQELESSHSETETEKNLPPLQSPSFFSTVPKRSMEQELEEREETPNQEKLKQPSRELKYSKELEGLEKLEIEDSYSPRKQISPCCPCNIM